eukprot:5089355-Alexandrium_andersonii.AAC.1
MAPDASSPREFTQAYRTRILRLRGPPPPSLWTQTPPHAETPQVDSNHIIAEEVAGLPLLRRGRASVDAAARIAVTQK